MRMAIVHDWLTSLGGADKLVAVLHEQYPQSTVYTLVYDPSNMPDVFRRMDIRTSYLQKIPFAKKIYRSLLPLMPTAVEQLDMSEYDLVLSSSSCCAKGIITRAETLHICYCHTPMRYGWDLYHESVRGKNAVTRLVIGHMMNRIRLWDRLTADRVDYFIANSCNVRNRIRKHYRRDARVIYPPVDTDFYTPSSNREDYYLVVSRLVPYKRIDLAIETFNDLGRHLVIIGDGPEFKKYKKMAGPNIRLLGRLPDPDVRDYYRSCRALIFPGEEDFGMIPVEVQACGRPVIAYGRGGALETVIEGTTGLFFTEQTAASLKDAVVRFEGLESSFDSDRIRSNALRFAISRFKKEISDFIEEKSSRRKIDRECR